MQAVQTTPSETHVNGQEYVVGSSFQIGEQGTFQDVLQDVSQDVFQNALLTRYRMDYLRGYREQ